MLEPGHHPMRAVIARALHAPDAGYYTRHIQTVGRAGDFSTSATLGRSLANAIARWAVAAAKTTGARHLLEVGAGDGSLAAGILKALPWWHPLRRSYRIVDVSKPLVERQRERLGNKARWFTSMDEALDDCGGNALIFGNELADAFPPTVLRYTAGAWEEMGLDISPDGSVREAGRPWTEGNIRSSAVAAANWPEGGIPAGQRIEVLDAFAVWMTGWLPRWKLGACLWLDYGAPFPALYHRRPHGTLRAYFRHERLDGMDVFRRLGKQDITCDVNFTDLQAWGEAAGLRTIARETQAEFFTRFGVTTSGEPGVLAAAAEAFQVLWQERG